MTTGSFIVGFVGMSHLGVNSAVVAADYGHKVLGYDDNSDIIKSLNTGCTQIEEPNLEKLLRKNSDRLQFSTDKTTLSSCDLIYISSDVATDDEGQSDLTTVQNYIEICLKYKNLNAIVVVLSQVPPGFTRSYSRPHLKLFYQVETLIFGRAIERAAKPERYIVGSPQADTPLPKCYRSFLESHGNPPVIKMSYESAELAKISINCLLVSSISAANTLAELCEKIGADWNEIIPALHLDRRIGEHSYIVPGLGLAGGNLERDISTVMKLGNELGCDTQVVQSWVNNSSYRKNWCYRILENYVFPINKAPNISILGLAYKENTNSVKNSASMMCLEQIKCHRLKVFDPVVPLDLVPYAIACDDVYSCIDGSDVLLLMTPWPEFKTLGREDLDRFMSGKVIIDPFGCLNHLGLHQFGFQYFCLGRS